MSIELIRETGARLSNWGRWGKDDQRGTLNHITDEAVAEAARLVVTGQKVRLGLNYDENGPQIGTIRGRFNPIHTMIQHAGDAALAAHKTPLGYGYTDDMIVMPLQCSTQWDGLAHVFYDDRIYNGFPVSEVLGAGALKNGMEWVADSGVIGRGVLLDIPRYKGVDDLPAGYAITEADLDGCASAEGVQMKPGDILLLRTGAIRKLLQGDKKGFMSVFPGLSFHTLDWLHRNRVAAIAVDNLAVEVRPTEFPDLDIRTPFHLVAIRDMGLLLGEIFDFEALAAACRADGRYAFLFTGSPLPLTRAVGSPLNPIAVK